MKWIKSMLPPYLLYAFLTTLVFLSYVGERPAIWKMGLAYIAGLIFFSIVSIIPCTGTLIRRSELYLKDKLTACWQNRLAIGKCIVILLADIGFACLFERIISMLFYKESAFYWGRFIVCFVIFELISLFFFYRKLLTSKIELGVMVVILSIGTIYVTALPASCGVSWDDEVHYNNTMIISHFFDKSLTQADKYLLESFDDTALKHEHYDRKSQQKYYDKLDSLYKSDKLEPTVRMLPKYKNLCFVPGAAGLLIGRALHLPYHNIFMLGKWFNLFIYSFFVYFAIRRLKSGKMIAAVVSLMPMNIFMASSYSYDPWMTGWILLGFCYFFGELQQPEKKMAIKDWIIMLLAFFIGVGPKVIYIPLILVTLFIPKSKYASPTHKKWLIIAVCIITCVVFAAFARPFLMSGGGMVQDNRGGADIDAGAQMAFIFGHALTYTKTLLGFLAEYVSLSFANSNMTYLHYFSNLQTAGYAAMLIALMMVVTFTDRDRTDCNVKAVPRITTIVLAFSTMCLVATSMYLAFTSVGSTTIAGCQYRYLIPVMFPIMYCIGSGRIENHVKREWYNGIVLAICSYILIRIVWTLAIGIY